MKTVKTFRLWSNSYVNYAIPSYEELLKNSKDTWDTTYDKIERSIIKGGIPVVLKEV